ncbi:MAG TPA: hypothetical protein VH253_06005 [Phycisphaerae bacterium]|nr:hypothetical protein [Phycisphaerae bacterium]
MPFPWDIAAGAFGIVAAVVIAGGAIVLRYQRDRYQFQLLHAALDKGITTLPGSIPPWLLSLRQGVLTLVLGVGLVGAGAALHVAARHIPEAPQPATRGAPPGGLTGGPGGGGAALEGGPGDFRPRPPRPGDAEGFPPPPNGRLGGENPPPPQNPPRPDPATERWHRIQTQQLAGVVSVCAGTILALLGVVRIAFARSERRYTA